MQRLTAAAAESMGPPPAVLLVRPRGSTAWGPACLLVPGQCLAGVCSTPRISHVTHSASTRAHHKQTQKVGKILIGHMPLGAIQRSEIVRLEAMRKTAACNVQTSGGSPLRSGRGPCSPPSQRLPPRSAALPTAWQRCRLRGRRRCGPVCAWEGCWWTFGTMSGAASAGGAPSCWRRGRRVSPLWAPASLRSPWMTWMCSCCVTKWRVCSHHDRPAST